MNCGALLYIKVWGYEGEWVAKMLVNGAWGIKWTWLALFFPAVVSLEGPDVALYIRSPEF